jgi:GNAT superfamily N-acetyltransferase
MIVTRNSNDCIIIQVKDKDTSFPIGITEASHMPGEDMFYFNRLYVNPKYRKNNYGTRLLNTLLDYIDSINGVLCLDINPYGEMTYDQLKAFYMKYGFKETDEYRLLYKAGGRSNE